MICLINLRSITCCAVVGIAACTAKTDNAQDTAMVVTGDTSMTSSTVTPTTSAPAATTGGVTSTTPTSAGTGGSAATATRTSGARPPAQPNHSINLNTASDEEILSIPGMGPRMLREFKEYRPYTSIEQFRREIGKYVDKAEVARLEQYVTIK
ncbi:MAG TPA: hypothetical protein VJ840_15730 [Gemmatimonadaceae bacterium]|nr:hypothetical protein [Gemmatimonadaceae bacterium]